VKLPAIERSFINRHPLSIHRDIGGYSPERRRSALRKHDTPLDRCAVSRKFKAFPEERGFGLF
jgi:hypothetical protein